MVAYTFFYIEFNNRSLVFKIGYLGTEGLFILPMLDSVFNLLFCPLMCILTSIIKKREMKCILCLLINSFILLKIHHSGLCELMPFSMNSNELIHSLKVAICSLY